MQLTVKTLKGEKFSIAVEETNSIAEVKSIIVSFLCDVCCIALSLRYETLELVGVETRWMIRFTRLHCMIRPCRRET